MAVIWGLDLKEMQWNKFKSGNMWNNEYHRRRTKFIVYQLAMIFCVVSESLGTAALADYVDQQKFVSKLNHDVTVHNNDFIGIAAYNIFVGIYVATIFGSAFFFDLFWPERKESGAVVLAWRVCSVLACLLALGSAIGLTVIVASHSAYVTGTNAREAARLLRLYGGSPMKYGKNGRAIASTVFIWPGMLATVASTSLLWHSLTHIDNHGPKSTHARTRDDITKEPEDSGDKELESGLMNESQVPSSVEPSKTNGAAAQPIHSAGYPTQNAGHTPQSTGYPTQGHSVPSMGPPVQSTDHTPQTTNHPTQRPGHLVPGIGPPPQSSSYPSQSTAHTPQTTTHPTQGPSYPPPNTHAAELQA